MQLLFDWLIWNLQLLVRGDNLLGEAALTGSNVEGVLRVDFTLSSAGAHKNIDISI